MLKLPKGLTRALVFDTPLKWDWRNPQVPFSPLFDRFVEPYIISLVKIMSKKYSYLLYIASISLLDSSSVSSTSISSPSPTISLTFLPVCLEIRFCAAFRTSASEFFTLALAPACGFNPSTSNNFTTASLRSLKELGSRGLRNSRIQPFKQSRPFFLCFQTLLKTELISTIIIGRLQRSERRRKEVYS